MSAPSRRLEAWLLSALAVLVWSGSVEGQLPGNAPVPSVGTDGTAESNKPTDGKARQPAVLRADRDPWPLRPGPAAPAAPSPVPPLPPGVSMGGLPAPPQKKDDPGSLQEFIQNTMNVKLRGAGTLRVYGHFRGDFDLATHRFTNDIQNPFFVLPNDSRFRTGALAVPVKPHDFNYSLYPRLTRLGAEYDGQPIDLLGGAVPGGRIEIDFLTGEVPVSNVVPLLNPESRALLRLRLAYATLTMEEWTLVVGQDWDIIAPLVPSINDNTLMWNAGNMGDRRPQIKLLWDHHLGDGIILQVQNGLALADAIKNPDIDGNGQRDQESYGLPAYEGRLGLIAPSHVENEKIRCGIWTLWANETMNGTLPPPFIPVPGEQNPTFSALTNHTFVTNGVGVDLRLPLACGLTFQGELFYGQNLADFRGGVGQGISPPRRIPIRSRGGWAELVYQVCPYYRVAVGGTVDDPLDSDLQGLNQPLFPGFVEGVNRGAGAKLNWTWYVSNRFLLGNGLTIGADYTNWNTAYVGFRAGHASLVKFFVQQAF